MKRKFILSINLAMVIVLLLVVAGAIPVGAQSPAGSGAQDGSIVGIPAKSPVALATLRTTGEVKADLIKRGLIIEVKDEKGEVERGQIKVPEIKKLVQQGVYSVDGKGKLRFGPSPTGKAAIQRSSYYIRGYMVTRGWFGDQYEYRGHQAYVKIPANVDLEYYTEFNVYNHHLLLNQSEPNYVESGVGWFRYGEEVQLWIYTYDDYEHGYRWEVIPDGVSRDIYLEIYVTSGYQAEMYARDTYTGDSIITWVGVPALDHRVDQCQEQCSDYAQWTETITTKHRDNKLKNEDYEWIDWNSSSPTRFLEDSPMHETDGTLNNRYWLETWCDP